MKRNVFFILFFILLVTLAAVSLVSCGKPSETTVLPNETTAPVTTAPVTTQPPVTTAPAVDAWQDKIPDFKEVGKDAALESAAKTPEGAYMTVVTLDASLATGDAMKAFLKEHSFKSHLYGIERDEGLIVYLNESGLERMAKLPEVLKIDILTESDPLSWMRKVENFYISNQDESTLYDPDNDLIRRLVYTDDGRFSVVATVSEQLSDGEIETLIGNIGLEGTVGMYFFGPAITFLCNNMYDLKTIAACEDVVTIDFVIYIVNA